MGGKQLPALRERLRDAIDEERLAAVLVAGLESESAKERLDVAKLVLAELHASTRGSAPKCTCNSAPGEWCGALEPHGYASRPEKAPGLGEVVALAFEIGEAVVGEGGEVVVDGRIVHSLGVPPVEEIGGPSVSGDPSGRASRASDLLVGSVA